MSLGGSRDSYMAQSTLRTGGGAPRPEPNGHVAKPSRRCERCGCKLASDTGPYRGHLLCSPCYLPIHHVAECISENNRERILMLCAGMTHSDVAEALGIGGTVAAKTMGHVAKQLGLKTQRLRESITWAIEAGMFPPATDHLGVKPPTKRSPAVPLVQSKPSEVLREKQRATAREYQHIIEAIARKAAAVPGLGDLIIGGTQCAHKHGYLQGKIEALETVGQ